jgi:glyoxylase-like metal-dependent hydrolase (beta-lactamase superfamily II)
MELVKGVYQIQIPLSGVDLVPDDTRPIKAKSDKLIDVIEQKILAARPLPAVNVYLIEGTKENILIDTGWDTPEAFATLNKGLRNYGFTFKDISQIIITHIHPDHYGLSGKLKQLTGGKIAISEIESGMIDSRYINSNELLKQVKKFLQANGVPKGDVLKFAEASLPTRKLVVPVMPDIKLKEGKKISVDPFEFKVIATPGHSPGHICLYEPNRKLLFTGDHILPEITSHIGLHPQSGNNPLSAYLSSLRAMIDLPVNFAFPGHGPACSGIRQIMESLIRHHEERNRAILKALQENIKSGYQVATELLWLTSVKPVNFENLNLFDQRLALTETLAHIDYLLNEGDVQKFEQEGTITYFAGG